MTFVPPPMPANFAAPPSFGRPPAPAVVPQQPAPQPVFRGQAPEEPVTETRPAPLTMPSPEQLGVAAARPADGTDIDWSAAHRRLNQLGAVCFHLEKRAQGGFRVTCLLPTAEPGRNHHVEAEAATEAEAVRLALERAESCAAGR